MSKRRYTHIQEILPEFKAMIANGKSHREIEEFFSLTGDRPVHNLLKRERRKEKNSIVAYKTGTSQSVNLVLDTIRLAIRKK